MDKKKVGIALLALPMFVSASVNYEKGTRNAQEYINTFSDYKKYILMGEAENGYGGFLSKNEFNLTYSNNRSYLAPGPAYWLKQEGNKKYIVDFSLKDVENGESGVRVTEFVKPETKVKGKGTQTTPWVFVNQYKVTVKSSNKSFGTIDENSKILYVEENGNVVVHIEPQPGYGYAGTSLDSELDSTITIEDVINEITLNNINSNEDVIVYFLPRSDVQYKVRHIFEGIGSTAPITQIGDSLKGTTGQLTNATALSNDSILEGFELDGNIEQKTISGGDGATVVDINYRRKSYTLTLNKSDGVKTVTGGGDYKFGADVDIVATLESGYALKGWYTNSDSENPYAYGRETSIEMPAGGLELTAKAYKSSSPDYNPTSSDSSSIKRYSVTYPDGTKVYYPSLDKALSALGNNVIEGKSTLSGTDGVPIADANTVIGSMYGTGVKTTVKGDTIKTTLNNCNVNCGFSGCYR